MDREDIKSLVKRWWDIYQDESLDSDKIIRDSNNPYPGPKYTDELGGFVASLSDAPQRNAPSAA